MERSETKTPSEEYVDEREGSGLTPVVATHWSLTERFRCRECGERHCYWCGQETVPERRDKRRPLLMATREHIPSLFVRRKLRVTGRVVLACWGCNNERGASPWISFHDRGALKMPTRQWLALKRLGYPC